MNLITLTIFKYYNFLSTFFENILFKNKSKDINSEINSIGHLTVKFQPVKIDLIEKIDVNRYMKKFILSNEQIEKIIDNLFVKNNLMNFLSIKTGFNYSINFIIAYETLPVSEEDKEKGWFANHWHRDKPFSQNTLKVIIPLENVGINDGGIEFCSIKDSKNLFKRELPICKIENFYKFVGNVNDVLIFNPNKCYHKAGYPLTNHRRHQIMIQLNPAREWSYCKNLFKKQYHLEPKFTLITKIFNEYKLIN